jgi:chemotaxis protein MotB
MISTPVKRAILILMATFSLAACGVSQNKYDALDIQYRQSQAQNAANQQQIASLNDQVNRLQHAIRYTVNSDLLFASGSWDLSKQGASLMSRLASQLAPFQVRNLVINGYTDNAPIGAALRKRGVDSNQTLSQRRAESVMAFLGTNGVKQEFMTAKGWGDAQPVAPNNTAEGRAQNRRVEITFAE